ncbi:MAG TPA: response regulator transcription factor [Bacteroidota bacterium]|nr:response regulator transcription factor [Bacteroidota bacterium]
MAIKVGIVEDDAAIREGVSMLVNSTPGFECRHVYASCEDAFLRLSEQPPDVLLMDIHLGGISGIEGVRQIKAKFPAMEVLMLTVFEENDKIFQSLCAGASGYLLKKIPPEELIEAIREATQGGAPMTASIARKVLSVFQTIVPAPLPEVQLTVREKQILEHLIAGSSYKMIARDLFISIDTVSSHVKNIYKKLQVHSKSEAVAKAIRHKLV